MTTQYCHSVQFFAASCETCGHKFSLPLLSDLSYGEFILHGDMEGVFGYLSAHDEPAWKDIDGQLRRAGLLPASPKSSDIDRLQRVIAVSADAINGQRLSLFPVCDSCGAPSIP